MDQQTIMCIVWVVAIVGFSAAEAATMSLISIWFAIGSLAGLIAAGLGAPIWAQLLVFIIVSGAVLAGIRPFATRWLKTRRVSTNADRNLGKTGRVTEQIDNNASSGAIYLQGKTWTARSSDSREVIPAGALVKVLSIEGVKLIVQPAEEVAVKN